MSKYKQPKFTIKDPEWTPFRMALIPENQKHMYAKLPIGGGIMMNSRYIVHMYEHFTPLGMVIQLSIARNDKKTIKDWRDMQRIKNELVGPDREAVELYPSESRLVDTSNQYHLWVLPKGMIFPFGFENRLVTEEGTLGSKQRPFETKPEDLADQERMKSEMDEHIKRVAEERARIMRESGMSEEDVEHLAIAIPR